MGTGEDSTISFRSETPRGADGRPVWAIAVALDCAHLAAPPSRFVLEGLDEIEIGRGEARAFVRQPRRRARLELADRSASQLHARLVRDGDRWSLEDQGAKNGTYLGRERVERADLDDGDVIGCGATFLVMRRAPGPIADLARPTADLAALRTISPTFEHQLGILPKIARSRLPVLVRGESGTGKELMAHAVHALSGRAGPFLAVNCGAIPATLIEAELFGSRRGAFSGAEERPGIVRNADHGTLFLDEVAELPLSSQVALLRVLQEGEVFPLGQGKPTLVDVRVVAASHQPLEALVARGQLRRDLFARLRGHEVHLPPLGRRREDLGLLIAALLARIEPDRPRRTLARRAARELFAHPFPFHVRELEQRLRAAAATAEGDEIDADDLQLEHSTASSLPPAPELDGDGAAPPSLDERARLVAALEHHQGNVSAVARDLETSRTQIHRLLDRHGVLLAAFQRR